MVVYVALKKDDGMVQCGWILVVIVSELVGNSF